MTVRWDRTRGRPEPIQALNKVLESENGEPLVDIRLVAPRVKIARPQVIPYVRESVAQMVHLASLRMPQGIHMGLVEGWRPIQRQQRIYDFVMKCAIEAFPNRDHASLRRTVCRWVAPTDQKAPPGHCTGAAVDIWLLDDAGKELDVCSPLPRNRAARTFTHGIGDLEFERRLLLHDSMIEVGFSNCRDEWWHYSFGDAGWAVRSGRSECFFGLVHLDESLYEGLEALSEAAFQKRPNPFLD